MKKISLSKILLVIVLSMLLVINITSIAFAADDLSSTWDDSAATDPQAGQTSTSTEDSTAGTTSTTGTTTTDGTTDGTVDTSGTDSNSSISTGSATTTLDSNEEDEEEKNEVNSLAYTGIEDNYILPIIIVIGAIVAGYSLRKLREYNI